MARRQKLPAAPLSWEIAPRTGGFASPPFDGCALVSNRACARDADIRVVRSALLESLHRESDDLDAALQREGDYGELFDANKRDYVAICGRPIVKIRMQIICAHSMQELQANRSEPCAELRVDSEMAALLSRRFVRGFPVEAWLTSS